LNSSISDRRASNSCVTWMVSVLSIPGTMPDYTGLSIGIITGLNRISPENCSKADSDCGKWV
jgi:hypothetical protein